jgi:hypothetical protein
MSSGLEFDFEDVEGGESTINRRKTLNSSEAKLVMVYSKASVSINPHEFIQNRTYQSTFICLVLKLLASPFLSVYDQV